MLKGGRILMGHRLFVNPSIRPYQKGITLTEMLIVLIILGIIAGLGIPSFQRAMENSRANEARTNLGIIHMGQRVFRANANSYWDGAGANVDITNANNAVNQNLSIDIQGSNYPSVTMTRPTPTTYTASMFRAASGWTFTVNETGVISCAPAGTCPCNPC